MKDSIQTSNGQIRIAEESDMHEVHRLVNELAVYEKAPEEHWQTPEGYVRDYRSNAFECDLLELGGEVIGLLLYFEAYSTWKGRTLYLDDFIITDKYRRMGFGEMLFQHFLKVAKKKNVVLIHWQVLEWNTPAIEFYKKYHSDFDQEWVNVKMILKAQDGSMIS